jgi:hypothetical protein
VSVIRGSTVLYGVEEERNIVQAIKRGSLTGWSYVAEELPSETRYRRKDRSDGEDEQGEIGLMGTTRKKT